MIKYRYEVIDADIGVNFKERRMLMNGYDGNGVNNNDPYNIFDKRGRRKNIGWSVASAVCAVFSVFLSIFGWAGIVLGVTGVILAIVSRVKLGYFNTWSIAGILIGIFGTVFSVSMVFISYTNPELIKEIFGFTGVPGTNSTVPNTPNTTNKM